LGVKDSASSWRDGGEVYDELAFDETFISVGSVDGSESNIPAMISSPSSMCSSIASGLRGFSVSAARIVEPNAAVQSFIDRNLLQE